MAVKLFVGNLPKNVEEITLIEMFSLYGMISSINIIRDKINGQNLGYGFIELLDEAAAKRAIDALDGIALENRKLSVRISEERRKPITLNGKPGINRNPAGVNGTRTKEFKKKRPRISK